MIVMVEMMMAMTNYALIMIVIIKIVIMTRLNDVSNENLEQRIKHPVLLDSI